MKYTNRMKVNGEMAVRSMNEQAEKGYCENEGIYVYEYEVYNEQTEEWEKLYSIKSLGRIGFDREGITFEEAEEFLASLVCDEPENE